MKSEIEILINRSVALSKADKLMYLAMLDHLPEGKLPALLKIFEDEQKATGLVNAEIKQENSQINKKYLEDLEEVYKTEYEKAVGKEEEAERAEGEDILKQMMNE